VILSNGAKQKPALYPNMKSSDTIRKTSFSSKHRKHAKVPVITDDQWLATLHEEAVF
jgi:hypothetical protein